MGTGNGNAILGIDPGISGGLVLLSPAGRILKKAVMPTREEGGLDLQTLGRLLFELSDLTGIVVLERPHGFTMARGRFQGAASNFNFGKSCGLIEGMVAAFRIPYVLIAPRTWETALFKDQDSKLPTWHKALTCAERYFPLEDFLATSRSRKPHDGLVDAALIATFGRMALECSPAIPEKWHGLLAQEAAA